ncbi:hypothetical protein DQ04_19591020, partial [Trypanosoma grayi]|uniref:hypothetical protein n=1 Tax=Trypanosoma grayi TaxID=71804 RepID=UPI0004F468FA
MPVRWIAMCVCDRRVAGVAGASGWTTVALCGAGVVWTAVPYLCFVLLLRCRVGRASLPIVLVRWPVYGSRVSLLCVRLCTLPAACVRLCLRASHVCTTPPLAPVSCFACGRKAQAPQQESILTAMRTA